MSIDQNNFEDPYDAFEKAITQGVANDDTSVVVQEKQDIPDNAVRIQIKNEYSNVAPFVAAAITLLTKDKVVLDLSEDGLEEKFHEYIEILKEQDDIRLTSRTLYIENNETLNVIEHLAVIQEAYFDQDDTQTINGYPLICVLGDMNVFEEMFSDAKVNLVFDTDGLVQFTSPYQPNVVGNPGYFIVIYDIDKCEIVTADELIKNYRMPNIEDFLTRFLP